MSHPSLQELTQAVHGLGPAPDHLDLCAECQETVDRLRSERDVLRRADVRLDVPLPKRRAGGLAPLAMAAAALLAVTAAIVLRSEAPPLPTTSGPAQQAPDVDKLIARFLDGTEKESARARELLVASASASLPALVEMRRNRPDVLRPDALSALLWDLKRKAAGQAADAILHRLKEARLEVEFRNTPLPEVLAYLAQVSAIGVYIDPLLDDVSVNLTLKKSTAVQALDLLAILYDLEFDVRYGVLFAGRPHRLFDLPTLRQAQDRSAIPTAGHWRRQELSTAGADLLRKLDRMTIDLEFANTPLSDVLEFVRDFSEANLILKPNAGHVPINLKAKGLSVASILELISLPLGLDLKIEGNVVILFTRS